MTESAHSLLEVSVDASGRSAHPLDIATGAALARCLEASIEHKSRAEALARIRGARRLQAFAVALEQQALLDAAGAEPQVHTVAVDGRLVAVQDEVISEIALSTRRSEAEVRRDLHTARTIEQSMPEVREALARGRVDATQAQLIARTADRLPEQLRASAGEQLLAAAERLGTRDLKASAETTVRTLDPDGRAEREARAARRRTVNLIDDVDGNSGLFARLAAADAHACLRLIDDAVAAVRDQTCADHDALGLERPTTGMMRADALVALIFGRSAAAGVGGAAEPSTSSGASASRRPIRSEIQIQVDLATLAGLRDGRVTCDGESTFDIRALRRWLAECGDVRFRRLITEPLSGQLLECGTSTYAPPAALRRFVVARDGSCVWPGCGEPAMGCDVDHAIPWEQGGCTDADNLQCLCRAHHLLKTHVGFEFSQDATGTWWLTAPSGTRVPVRASTSDPPPE